MNKSLLGMCLCGLSSLCFAGLGQQPPPPPPPGRCSYLRQGFDPKRVQLALYMLELVRKMRPVKRNQQSLGLEHSAPRRVRVQ